ncbi:hypothetical protein ACP4OV_002200 [Aristida adscensionis]
MAAIRRRAPGLALLAAVLVFLAGPASADLVNQTGQITVFWGRHKGEGSLREACDTGMYTTVIMSFLDVYGHGRYRLDLSGHPLAGVGADIKHCQSVGVRVSLAVGGFRGGYSLPTRQSALDLFDHLWSTYLRGDLAGRHRPFGDAWLDGVDLFLEHAAAGERYDVLARRLAEHNIRAGAGKPLHLTATPRCHFPAAAAVRRALDTGVFEEWGRWTAAYPGSRIFLGLPASDEAARGYWIFPKDLYYGVMPAVQRAANYGGVMIWDRFYDEQANYSAYVKGWA